jgi:uncharacterized protein with NAD-binding domain and iron-sulfur cluster
MTSQRKKVVILGGGLGSLTTAFELTNAPDWRERFESITVYQQGWRLGGKGASGRGPDGRIEEHGLHIWMGWYQNAFRMIRAAYQEMGRPPSAPLATWDQAFKRHSFINLGEQVKGKWTNWPLDFPATGETPGNTGEDSGEYPTVWHCVSEVLQGLYRLLARTLLTTPPKPPKHRGILGELEKLGRLVENAFELIEDMAEIAAVEFLLHEAHSIAHALAADPSKHQPQHSVAVAKRMHKLRDKLLHHLEDRLESSAEARRLFCIIDVAITCVAGALSEVSHMGAHSLDSLDKYDFREFLTKHGGDPLTVNSSVVKAFYDLMLAYRDGNPGAQVYAAGAAMRFIFRMVFTFKGAIFWKMQAGMGDTIFTPLYQVLKQRGVQFKFFHRVRNLVLGPDQRSVVRIELGQQATVKSGEYDPLFDVQGLPCWPSEPLYAQLKEGDELRTQKINLESFWTPWQKRETRVPLEVDRDFHLIVFGISLGGVPFVAPELVAASTRWHAMVQNVETVRTQAAQIWMRPNIEQLGWTLPSAVTDTYPEPLDTWADMTHLLPREDWRAPYLPNSVTYFCAPMPGGIPPVTDSNEPAKAADQVKANTIDWLTRNATIMWPKAGVDGKGFDWNLLVDTKDQAGVARFDSQFWRANIDPSERYVMSVPHSTQYRLHANDPDFTNVFVTGDWTYCGINGGCVEAAVMSGMLTANAITGTPRIEDIIGYQNP